MSDDVVRDLHGSLIDLRLVLLTFPTDGRTDLPGFFWEQLRDAVQYATERLNDVERAGRLHPRERRAVRELLTELSEVHHFNAAECPDGERHYVLPLDDRTDERLRGFIWSDWAPREDAETSLTVDCRPFAECVKQAMFAAEELIGWDAAHPGQIYASAATLQAKHSEALNDWKRICASYPMMSPTQVGWLVGRSAVEASLLFLQEIALAVDSLKQAEQERGGPIGEAEGHKLLREALRDWYDFDPHRTELVTLRMRVCAQIDCELAEINADDRKAGSPSLFSEHRGSGASWGDPHPAGEHSEADPVAAFLAECEKYASLQATESLILKTTDFDALSDELAAERLAEVNGLTRQRFRIRNSLQSLADDVAAEVRRQGKDPEPIYSVVMTVERDATRFVETWRKAYPLLRAVRLGASQIASDATSAAATGTVSEQEEVPNDSESSEGALRERFIAEIRRFDDSLWSKCDRRWKDRAKQGRGRKVQSFYIEGVGGIYYGDRDIVVFKCIGRSGYHALSASHSTRIGRKIASQFRLHR